MSAASLPVSSARARFVLGRGCRFRVGGSVPQGRALPFLGEQELRKTVIAEPLLPRGSSPPLISALLALRKLVPWFTPNTRFHKAVWLLAL